MSFVDLLFPKFCLNCHLPGAYICPRCQNELKFVDRDTCFFCKRSSLYNLTHPSCLKKFNIDSVNFLFSYNNLLKKIIKNIKYRLATEIWKEFTLLINSTALDRLAFYKKLSGRVYFQPIPLFPNKLKDRGFNQALLITKFFNNFLKFPIANFLIRVKDTKAQAELKTKKERYNNLRGAFKINPGRVKGSKIILVDDVVTTGSTVKEAAKVLKRAGAEKVYILALAKG